MAKLRAVGHHVLTQKGEAPEAHEGGMIQIPEAAQEKYRLVSKVLAVGEAVERPVSAGDTVIFPMSAGMAFRHDGEMYSVVHEDDILVVVEE